MLVERALILSITPNYSKIALGSLRLVVEEVDRVLLPGCLVVSNGSKAVGAALHALWVGPLVAYDVHLAIRVCKYLIFVDLE